MPAWMEGPVGVVGAAVVGAAVVAAAVVEVEVEW